MLTDKYYEPNTLQRRKLMAEANTELYQRRKVYEKALKYYNGVHPEQLSYEEGEVNDNTIVNLVKMAAERTSSFLFRGVPKIKTDVRKIEQTIEEKMLEDMLEFNGGLRFLQRIALSGFLSGHSFIRVIPKKKFDKFPRLQLLDPMSVTIYWDIDNQTDVVFYEHRFVLDNPDKPNKKDEYIVDYVKETNAVGYYWKIIKYKQGSPNEWQVVETGIHEDEIAPIVDIPHLPHPVSLYGVGEFTSEAALQDSINRIASQISGIIRENANPVDVLTGSDPDDVEDNGTLITVANPNARVSRLEMGGDVTKLQSILNERIALFLALMRVVLLKGEAKDLQRVTNASVRMLFLDMLAKNDVLRGAYTNGLVNICKLSLAMLQLPKPDTLSIIYIDPLPTDELEKAQINKILTEIGARSLKTISEDMGDNWLEETENLNIEYAERQAKLVEQQKAMNGLTSNEDEPIDNE